MAALTSIPTLFGSGGSGLTPKGSGSPTLRDLLEEHRAAIEALRATVGAANAEARFASTGNRASLSGLASTGLDGTPVAGDVILLKNQSTPAQNGLYVAASGAWTRLKDAAGNDVISAGLKVVVTEGATLADTQWILTTNETITVGTTALSFSRQISRMSQSSEVTGNGSEQDFAHGLGATPAFVIVELTELPADLTTGADVAKGTHDATNAKVTVTSGIKYVVTAIA